MAAPASLSREDNEEEVVAGAGEVERKAYSDNAQ